MPIVTETYKKLLTTLAKNQFDSAANNYYIGVGRAEVWNDSDVAPTPVNSQYEIRQFRNSMQAVKKVEDVSFIVPRYNWISGTTYSAYDDRVAGYPANAYYVVNSSFNVYICLQRARNALGAAVQSTVEPTGTSTSAFTTADGYTWKYLYTISAGEQTRYVSANHIPVKYIDSADPGEIIQVNQEAVQNAAVDGQILNIVVTAGGTGYTSAPSVVISGTGTSAAATATVSGGSVVKVEMSNRGSGYDNAVVSFTGGGGTGAKARAVIGPKGGIGADARNDLRADALMFNSRPTGTEAGDTWLVDQSFRQIALMQNITKTSDGSDFTAADGDVLNSMRFNGTSSPDFIAGNLVVGGTSGAKGFIDFVDSSAGLLYHFNDSTGYTAFQAGEVLTSTTTSGAGAAGSATLLTDSEGTVNRYSGDILYIDNRASITRGAAETQDIKIIIQL